ncbi:MAG TPA: ABC-2 transporter permease [Rhodanobacteraceae bacterium]|nr:ABC-2 transporter permease [Rhodanobacteraceae bacterium]
MKTFYWLVKREFWEHRGGFLWAPVWSAGIVWLTTLMGIISAEVFRSKAGIRLNGVDIGSMSKSLDADNLTRVGYAIDAYMMSPAFLVSVVMFVVVLFYAMNTLAEDRRDRSILFWKSLPVSDRDTVLSKLFCAAVLVPAIAIAVSIAASLAMLILVAVVAAFHGFNLGQVLWSLPHPFSIAFNLIANLPLYVVWALPSIGWLLLASAWSRSRTFLWAIMLPVGAGVLVSWFNLMGSIGIETSWFWKNIVGRALLSIYPGSWMPEQFYDAARQGDIKDPSTLFNVLHVDYSLLLTAPFLIGAVAGIVMIAAAIWLRRWRTDA